MYIGKSEEGYKHYIEDKKTLISNAVMLGMYKEDAYIYAALTADDKALLEADETFMSSIANIEKAHEFDLLNALNETISAQKYKGKEKALIWALEHLFPRYKADKTADIGTINIKLGDNSTADVEKFDGN
jgi:hypothetical protein